MTPRLAAQTSQWKRPPLCCWARVLSVQGRAYGLPHPYFVTWLTQRTLNGAQEDFSKAAGGILHWFWGVVCFWTFLHFGVCPKGTRPLKC